MNLVQLRRALVARSTATLFAALLLASTRLLAADPAFDAWAEGFAAEWAQLNPQFVTQAQYNAGTPGQDAADRQLTLFSPFGGSLGISSARTEAALARQGLKQLQKFNADQLAPVQRSSAALMRWAMQDAIAGAEFATHRPIFNQMSGLHLHFVKFMTQTHPVRNRRDVENYLARLDEIAPRMDEGIADASAAAAAGVIPPRFILERTIAQLDQFLSVPAHANVFVESLAERMAAMPEKPSQQEISVSVSVAEKIALREVIPAYRRARDLLASQLPRATDDAGVWRLPRGAEFYARELAHSTTTSLTATEIHAIGLREVARIEAEMDVLLRQVGFAEGTLQQRVEALNASMLPPGEDPRPALLAQTERAVRDAERRAQPIFGLQPKAPVIVQREPAISEASAAANYAPPAPDGSRPGIYRMPLAHLDPKVTWIGAGLKSTAYHETVPGHHFQLVIQQESTTLPKYRKLRVFGLISAYSEGWALYAERLADENGWYADDPRRRIGYLSLQLFRARRLVADTGLHAMRWTRQQAIDYGLTPTEVERYIVWPGQACSYMIGQLRIMELRERARAAMGDDFSVKDFHDLVLGLGTVPLDVLGSEVDYWISHSKGAEPRVAWRATESGEFAKQ